MVEWAMAHPWMTFFLLLGAMEAGGKVICYVADVFRPVPAAAAPPAHEEKEERE